MYIFMKFKCFHYLLTDHFDIARSLSRSTTFDSDCTTSLADENINDMNNMSNNNTQQNDSGVFHEDQSGVPQNDTDSADNMADDDSANANITNGIDQEEGEKDVIYQPHLHSKADAEQKFAYSDERSEHEAVERECARSYICELLQVLPVLLEAYGTRDVDEMVQKFASNFCSSKLYPQFLF